MWELQAGYFRPVFFSSDYKLVPGSTRGGKIGQYFRTDGGGIRVAGVCELGGDIPLVHPLCENGTGGKCSVRLHLDEHIGRQQREQSLDFVTLQQGFTTCDNESAAAVAEHSLCDFLHSAIAARQPAVTCIAPATVQVAAGQSQEHGRAPRSGSFPLQGIKYLRLRFQACNVHGGVVSSAVQVFLTRTSPARQQIFSMITTF